MFEFADYDQIKIDDVKSLDKTITIDDVNKFVEITGDDNPLHVNGAFAETTAFKDIVVHGMLGASYISTIIGTKLPGPGALWVSQSFNFLKPVRIGDKLTVSCRVKKKFDSERMLELEALIVNQNKETILSGEGRVKLLTPSNVVKPNNSEKSRPAKVAIVTGGSGGIGSSISKKLVESGWSVFISYKGNDRRADSLVNDLNAIRANSCAAVRCSLDTDKACEELYSKVVQTFGHPTGLVFNASPSISSKPIDKLEWDDLQAQLDVQLRSALQLTKLCVPQMIKLGYGKIVSITSQVVDGQPTQGWTAYAVAKSALETFTRYMSSELGPHGITANSVSPGMCQTSLIGSVPEKTQLMTARQTPLRRLAMPEDVANAVEFLMSENGCFVNGQVLPVNGGLVSR